mmetsp:Transcript_10109/g.24092  ORF Transcript_10109/g.24092 Transcript_10109/m.24092 type:complete len:131 (+) Transcript_10109:127-519(+)
MSMSLKTSSSMLSGQRVALRSTRSARGSPARMPVRAAFDPANTSLVISGCNAAMLALGRFAFLPYTKKQQEKAGLPVQNGKTHFEAGDIRAEEASFITRAGGDPAGFTIIDVLAWGSLGHVLGFLALALS